MPPKKKLISSNSRTNEYELYCHSEILKNVSEGIFLIRTSDGQIVYANPRFEHMFGYGHDELIGKHVSVVNAPSDISPEARAQLINDALLRDGRWNGEVHNIRRDGTRFWCHVSVSTFEHSEFGQVWVAVHDDITKRKQLEENLRESEILRHLLLTQEILLTSLDGYFEASTLDGRIINVNEAYCCMVGYSQKELLALSIYDLESVESAGEISAHINNIQKLGYDRFETSHRHKKGHLVYVEVSVSHSHIDAGVLIAFIRDITERKLAETNLQSSKARLEAALSSMNDAVSIFDAKGHFVDFNDAYVNFHKFGNRDECCKAFCDCPKFFDICSPSGELQPVEQWPASRALRGEVSTNSEFTLRRRDTGETWVGSYSYAPIRDTKGVIVGSVVTARDITAAKQAEAFTQSILNSVPAEIAVLDRNGIILAVNLPWQNFAAESCVNTKNPFPYADVGANYLSICLASSNFEPGGGKDVNYGIRAVLDGRQKSFTLEYLHHLPKRQRWLLIHVTPLGKSVNEGVVIALADITNLKKAEEAVSQSHNQLKTFIEQSPISIAMLDKDMNYLAVSGHWIKEYGQNCFEMVGLNHFDLHSDLLPPSKAVIEQALTGATVKSEGDIWISSDSKKHWLRWVALPWFDEYQEIGGILLSFEDITDSKMLEMEISQRRFEMEHQQKMHVAAQTAAAIAHEMNQPLLAIASYSQAALIMMKSKEPDLDEIFKAIERSEQQAQRAGRSIHDLINFLSIKSIICVEEFDFEIEIQNILDTARSDHNLNFHSILRVEQALPLIRANRLHVQKVLLNLLHNSIEANQLADFPLSVITLSVCTATDKSFAQLSVQDNGPGIKEELFHRVFEPFFTTKPKGVGIGLAICRSLIEENGGNLWVEPRKGPGATFHLTLPFSI